MCATAWGTLFVSCDDNDNCQNPGTFCAKHDGLAYCNFCGYYMQHNESGKIICAAHFSGALDDSFSLARTEFPQSDL
eukprot:SAG11_NODE_25415_length_359_cov_0.561538_1_plen_76_part_10